MDDAEMTSGTVAALAGEPVLKYFDLKAAGLGWAGRGGAVRFFLLAAGAPFQEEVVHYDGDWANNKKAIIESGEHCMGQLPVVKLDGKILTESYAINRYFAKKLGLYGKDDEEDFMADAVADLVVTMRQDLVTATLGDDAAKATWKTEQRPRYYTAVEAAVSKFGGGANGHVVASSHLTFADPIVAAILHDDAKTFSSDMLDEYPTLKAFYSAFVEMNPDVKAWIEDNAKP